MFINLSNHPSSNWTKEQIEAAEQFGEIVDVPSPLIDANCDEKQLMDVVDNYLVKVLELKPVAVMCQAEFTFTFAMVSELQAQGIKCLAACSDRVTEEKQMPDGTVQKVSVFRFARFREYTTK